VLADQPPCRERVESLLVLAEFHLGRGQLQRAQAAAERALDTLERLKAPDLRSRIYSVLANIASRQNDHARSLSLNRKAMAEIETGSDTGGGAQCPIYSERLAEVTGAIGENCIAR